MTMIRPGLFASEGNAVPLLGVDVRAEVLAGHACAVVRQRYRNEEARPIEAVYTFPLPSRATLTGFSMTAAGRRVEGEVREREEAFRRYDEAIAAGHGGALLDQERPNVFTASVGNLLPGEETIIEIRYVEPVLADEGAVRWSIPTLVAPRYIPGVPGGDRTAHGVADPTDRVPDADRISPPIGDVSYGISLDLTFSLGVALDVESPSHAIVVTEQGAVAHVAFAKKEVALDRDVVVTAVARSPKTEAAPIASAISHRAAGGTGTVAVTIVPDLGAVAAGRKRNRGNDLVFVLDRSGSMGGTSMPEARTALRLCLRQLREGDRFGILAFDDTIEPFAPQLVPFTQATLQQADAWLETVDARGGTELLAPMREAARLAPDGVIVVLTDGEVGNEDEILAEFMAAQRSARVYSFGIGTNVSDALLHALADKTGGAVEMIHPGERVDEKVVAQFARATAPRVTDLTIKTRGIELGEIAPAEPKALVDSEPFCLFATYEEPGRGALEIRGKLDGEAFFLDLPIDLDAESTHPVVAQLWAQARIRDLERAIVTGRRAESMKERIIKLSTTHGVSSKFTSFVVVETRTGDRRSSGMPETRVVPVNAPAGWSMFTAAPRKLLRGAASRGMPAPAPRAMAMPMSLGAPPPTPAAGFGGGGFAPRARLAPLFEGAADGSRKAESAEEMQTMVSAMPSAPAPAPAAPAASTKGGSSDRGAVLELLSRQAASGLWEQPGKDSIRLTVDALLTLFRSGITTAHTTHGAQLKKAVEALLARLASEPLPVAPSLHELALAVAWIVSSGRRTRQAIEATARAGGSEMAALAAALDDDESGVRGFVEALSPP